MSGIGVHLGSLEDVVSTQVLREWYPVASTALNNVENIDEQVSIFTSLVADATDQQALAMLMSIKPVSKKQAEEISIQLAPMLVDRQFHLSLCYVMSNLPVDHVDTLLTQCAGQVHEVLTRQLVRLARKQPEFPLSPQAYDLLIKDAQDNDAIDMFLIFAKKASVDGLCDAVLRSDKLACYAQQQLIEKCKGIIALHPNSHPISDVTPIFWFSLRENNQALFDLCSRQINQHTMCEILDDTSAIQSLIDEYRRRFVEFRRQLDVAQPTQGFTMGCMGFVREKLNRMVYRNPSAGYRSNID